MNSKEAVVVMRASYGGLPPLCRILAALPSDFAAAIFIVLHTKPHPSSYLADVLGRAAR